MKVINHILRYHSPWKLLTKEVKKWNQIFFSSGLFYLYKVARTWGSEQWSNFLCWNLLKRFSFNSQKLRIIEMKNNCRIRFSLNVAKKCWQFSVFLNFSEGKNFCVRRRWKLDAPFSASLANYSNVFTSHGCLLYTFIECWVLSVLIFPHLYANGENVKFNRKTARGERQLRRRP